MLLMMGMDAERSRCLEWEVAGNYRPLRGATQVPCRQVSDVAVQGGTVSVKARHALRNGASAPSMACACHPVIAAAASAASVDSAARPASSAVVVAMSL